MGTMSIHLPKSSISTLQHATRTFTGSSHRHTRGYATKVKKEAEGSVNATQASHETSLGRVLTWPEYLAIRRSRHIWQTVAMIPSGLLGLSSGVGYFASLNVDPMKPIFGFDPFMVHGFLTAACLGFGVLVGPTIGGSVWRFTHRKQVDLIDEKDREFINRIAKNRVDASLQSATSPVPDYYGERVGSLHQYRQWLRDQAKYRKKVVLPEKED